MSKASSSWIVAIAFSGILAAACTQPSPSADGGGAKGQDGDRTPAALIARGDYLVNVVISCSGCHTPKLRNGQPDATKKLAGWNCFVRGKLPDGSEPAVGTDPGGAKAATAGAWCGPGCEPDYTNYGCLHTNNLTNHETGLKNYTDAQIKEMIAHGKRPNGSSISPIMGYWTYSQLSAYDLDAIVAYLRSVPGIENRVPAAEWPWNLAKAARPVNPEKLWKPQPGAPNYESMMRGRYLATVACLECHSPYRDGLFAGMSYTDTPIDEDKLFSGIGFPWSSEVNKIPSPPFPRRIYAANLTQDVTGLKGWTADEIVKAVRDGIAKDGSRVCPPMPTGKMAAGMGHGGLTDADARDIANYIVALPPIPNQRPADCVMPSFGPPGGGPPGGGPPGGGPPGGGPPGGGPPGGGPPGGSAGPRPSGAPGSPPHP